VLSLVSFAVFVFGLYYEAICISGYKGAMTVGE
jgi:hypothetical protein